MANWGMDLVSVPQQGKILDIGCGGGGNASTLLVFDGNDSDWTVEPNAVLHNEKYMLLNPYIDLEYALTDAVHLTLKADRLTPLTGEAVPTGVRIYLGFIFAH